MRTKQVDYRNLALAAMTVLAVAWLTVMLSGCRKEQTKEDKLYQIDTSLTAKKNEINKIVNAKSDSAVRAEYNKLRTKNGH